MRFQPILIHNQQLHAARKEDNMLIAYTKAYSATLSSFNKHFKLNLERLYIKIMVLIKRLKASET